MSAAAGLAQTPTPASAAAEAAAPWPDLTVADSVFGVGQPDAGQAIAALLLALALLLPGTRPGRGRLRSLCTEPVAGQPPPLSRKWMIVAGVAMASLTWVAVGGATGLLAGLVFGAATAIGVLRAARVGRGLGSRPTEGADLAAGWELMATCLQAGLPVAAAANAAAERIDGEAAESMRRVAGLLQLGSAPDRAWATMSGTPCMASFARAAQRSADTGAGLARVAHSEAVRLREGLVDQAEARAERAAVLIAAPLGLCFLPAFFVLGIVPVVIGLAGEVLTRW